MDRIKLPDSYNSKFVEIATKNIRKHTCQIFIKSGEFGFKPWGSAVLATIKKSDYLFSASHVIEYLTIESPGYIHTPLGFLMITGDVRESDINANAKIDIAYIKLEQRLALELKKYYEFLTEQKILKNHKPLDTTQYLTLGFPIKMFKKENGKIISGFSFHLHSIMKERVYKIERYNETIHYLIDFTGKGTGLKDNKKRQKIRDPFGISGSGLWYISVTQELNDFEFDYYLIGIMFWVEKSRFHYLVANKIELIINEI